MKEYRLEFNFKYGDLMAFFRGLSLLYGEMKANNAFHYETGEVEEMIQEFTQSLNNTAHAGKETQPAEIKFNKTRVKELTEKFCFPREFRVKRILPLVEIDGLLCVTNARLYF